MESDQGTLILTLFEKINLAIFILDKDLRYENINKKGLELLNVTKENILGKKFTDIYPDALQTKFGKHLQLVRKTDVPQEWEFYSLTAKEWLRVNAYKTSNTIILLFTNINKQHYFEDLLEERVTLLDLSFDAIQIQDEHSKILYWNKGAERMYGWKAEEVIGKISYEVLGTNFQSGYQKFFRQLRKKKYWTGILHHTTKAKKRIIVESTWTCLEKNGKIQILEINRDVTEKESAKEQLLLNERRFRSLIEHNTDGIVIRDMHMHAHYASPAITRILGYTPEAFLKINIMDLIHPEDRPLFAGQNKQLEKGKPIIGVFRVKNKKGEWRWLKIYSRNLLNDPAVQGVVTNVRDITDNKLYQAEIENQNKKITEILENFNYAYFAINKDWKYTYVNKKALEFAQKQKKDLLGKSIWDLFPEIKDRESGKNMIKVMQSRIPVEYESYYPPDKRWYHHYSYPTEAGIAEYTSDITEKKNTEQEIESTRKEHDAILQHMPHSVIVQDEEGNIVYANDEAVKLTDYSSSTEMLHAPRFDYIYKFDLRDQYGKKFPIENLPGRRAIKSGVSEQIAVKFINKKTGEGRWVTITASPIIGHENKPLVVIVIEDITEFKEADVRKSDFISMASHELKTPLTSLKVYMHLLLDMKKADEAKKYEYVVRASDEVDRLQNLVSEMLDQSTIQQGKLSLHAQEMYFDFFVKEFMTNFQQTTDGFTILLKGKTESLVSIDKYRIEQVLANLLSNSIKYSRDKKEIIVSLSKKDNNIVVSVKDFGRGIPPSEIDNVFKPYYRVIGKKENTFPGMGIGLYISKDIIDKHGGNISVESALGKGTTFTITLPIAN